MKILDCINAAKLLTAFCILYLAATYGFHDSRQVLYAGLHGSYLAYWYLHQVLLAGDHKMFQKEAATGEVVMALLVVGVAYAAPAYFAFSNPTPISALTATLGIFAFSIGSVINVASDFYKAGAKQAGQGLVTGGPFQYSLRPNYFGDWFRYASFAIVSGSLFSFLLPAFVGLINTSEMKKQLPSNIARYGKAFESYAQKTPLIVPFTTPALPVKANGRQD